MMMTAAARARASAQEGEAIKVGRVIQSKGSFSQILTNRNYTRRIETSSYKPIIDPGTRAVQAI